MAAYFDQMKTFTRTFYIGKKLQSSFPLENVSLWLLSRNTVPFQSNAENFLYINQSHTTTSLFCHLWQTTCDDDVDDWKLKSQLIRPVCNICFLIKQRNYWLRQGEEEKYSLYLRQIHPNVFNLDYISLTKHNIEENVKKMALVLNNLLTLINEFTYVCAIYTIPHSSF